MDFTAPQIPPTVKPVPAVDNRDATTHQPVDSEYPSQDRTTRQATQAALNKFKQEERDRALAAKAEAEKQDTSEEATPDPWDVENAAQQPEGFEQFRQQAYRGHSITPSDAVLTNTRVEVEEVHSAATDVGIAARRDGVSKEGAQAIFDMVAQDYQPPQFGTYDEETAMQHMRASCGEQTEEVLADLRGWVSKRPAVVALLEEGVQFGNHPGVLLTLGAIAQAAKGGLDLTKPADAKVYAERMLNDTKSAYWTDGPLHKLTVRGVQYAHAVAGETAEKKKR